MNKAQCSELKDISIEIVDKYNNFYGEYSLEKFNDLLLEIKAYKKGLSKVILKRKKWKEKYYTEKRKNKNLKTKMDNITKFVDEKMKRDEQYNKNEFFES